MTAPGGEAAPWFAPRAAPAARWTIARSGRVVHEDSDEHAALVARTLGVSERLWRAVLDRYDPAGPGVPAALAALGHAFAACAPGAPPAPGGGESCEVCGAGTALAHARPGPRGALAYSLCGSCGHGALASGGLEASVYQGAGYYEARDATGAGYDRYGEEHRYREAKGQRLVAWIDAGTGARRGRALLEVGSGFSYTRKAAEDAGLRTAGVDVSRHAAAAAAERYGLSTHVGSLAECLADGRVERGGWDVVLYQFVLEHVEDPLAELRSAASALSPGGTLAIVVPSMDAAEVAVFGGHYRSFRGDHLHVFSRRSLALLLGQAGLELRRASTACSLHLLRGLLDDTSLAGLYAAGLGPDLYALASRKT